MLALWKFCQVNVEFIVEECFSRTNDSLAESPLSPRLMITSDAKGYQRWAPVSDKRHLIVENVLHHMRSVQLYHVSFKRPKTNLFFSSRNNPTTLVQRSMETYLGGCFFFLAYLHRFCWASFHLKSCRVIVSKSSSVSTFISKPLSLSRKLA